MKYVGELDWKVGNSHTSLLTLLFTDILVFLEKIPTNDHEKQRYALKPLVYSLGKNQKNTFTPVIPTICINSFREMDKRGFYLVVLIKEEEENKTKKQKSSMANNQMLFMLTAKSGDDKAKWLYHLQSVIKTDTNKLQSSDIDSSSKSSLVSLTKQTSDASLISSSSTATTFDTTGLDSNKNHQLDPSSKVGGLTDDEKLLRSKKFYYLYSCSY